MTRAELLPIVRAARAMVSDPARWNSRNFAQDGDGHWVPVGSPRAVSFDLRGALVRASGGAPRHAIQAIMQVIAQTSPRVYAQLQSGQRPVTHEQALDSLDRTIEYLGRESLTPGDVLQQIGEIASPGRDATGQYDTAANAAFLHGNGQFRAGTRR